MPVILTTQEVRRIVFEGTGKQFMGPYLEKALHKKELLEWLKV
jgi:hypothetical protein